MDRIRFDSHPEDWTPYDFHCFYQHMENDAEIRVVRPFITILKQFTDRILLFHSVLNNILADTALLNNPQNNNHLS
jgi:hypothetical protein